VNYLDFDRLESLDASGFQQRKPYPWINPVGLITEEGYRRLVRSLPDIDKFTQVFGLQRSHGQKPHDRYALDYHEDLDVAQPWHEFVAELRGLAYRRFLKRMFGRGRFRLGFHWHYTPNGCSVSPHCDAKRKLGSHIFYFNTEQDWNPAWGGETLILDDRDRFKRESAPEFGDFDRVIETETLDNRSLLFARRQKSWHGVREIHCPDDACRKVFIVVINDLVLGLARQVVGRLRGERASGY
jgi:hypothetical protein